MNDQTGHPNIRQSIKYLLLRLLGLLLSLLPHQIALIIAEILGVIAFDVVRRGRRMALHYLAQVFPEKTPAERRAIGRAGHCNLIIVAMEMMRARFAPRERVISRVELDTGSEKLIHNLMEEGRGIIFVGSHYSNWEYLGARLAAVGYPFLAIVQDHPNPLFNRYLSRMRRRLGIDVVRRSEAVKGVLRFLKDGGAVGIVADQDASRFGGVVTDFFGKPVTSFKGPFAFAVKCNSPLVAAWVYRENGRYRAGCQRLDEEALADLEPEADDDVRILKLTQSFIQWLEGQIIKDPGQYLWLHPRWQAD
jgi:KDO2-lipid IV(A) lauroyltransferase